MSAVQIKLSRVEEDLFCKSKWWGNPDIPEGFTFDDSLMFVCQIRCEDLVNYDVDNKLPHKGMLYFFCDVAYYLGYYDEFDPPSGALWDEEYVKVYYSDNEDYDSYKQIIFDDDYFPEIHERKIDFEIVDDDNYGNKLLGVPCQFEYEDWESPCEGWINLLQIDSEEDDDYNLMFMDEGTLYIIIDPSDLSNCDFTKVRAYIYST